MVARCEHPDMARVRLEQQLEFAFERLTGDLKRHVEALEEIGENDVGLLNYDLARRFHSGTETLRKLLDEITRRQ